MNTEHDTFDDPGMSQLLHHWGRAIRGSTALFEPPGDLNPLWKRLEDMDHDLSEAQAKPRLIRLSWMRGGLALAAALALMLGGWWIVQQSSAPDLVLVSQVTAHPDARLLRDAEHEMTFRSGDSVFLHFDAEQAGQAAVAMIDSKSQFAIIRGAERITVSPNHNSLGPFILDENTGIESFIVIIGPRFDPDLCAQGVQRELDRLERSQMSHAELLRHVTEALNVMPNVTVRTVTIKHLPAE